MANKTITDLPSATTVGQTDEIEIAQSGVSKRATINKLTSLVTGPTGPAGPTGPSGPAATPGGSQFATQYNGGSALTGGSLGTALQVWTSNGAGVAPSMQTIPNFSSGAAGHAPASGGGTSNFLRADGSWAAPPATVLSANPSASIGLTQVNGVATTFMRSDAAPALDVSISPSWSGTHTFAVTPVVPDDSWTYAKIQDISATSRLLGRITAGAGSIEELTGTQVTTLLDAFTSTLKGLTPASGGGTTNFLRADGTWATPPSGTPGGSDTYVQFNDGSAFGGDADFTWNKTTNVMKLGAVGTPATITVPANGSGAGVGLTIAGGDSTSSNGSSITIRGGTRTGATTTLLTRGNVNIVGGAGGTTGGAGGAVQLTGGSPSVGNNGAGGFIALTGATGDGTGAGGIATLTGGQGGATGAGGAITISSGSGGSTSGSSGTIVIVSGTVPVSGNSGSIFIETTEGGGTSGNSGDITLVTGTVSSGNVGNVSILIDGGNVEALKVLGTGANITLGMPLKKQTTTVAGLPSAATATVGACMFVTNATATTFNSIVVGGGANNVPVFSDGTNWRIG